MAAMMAAAAGKGKGGKMAAMMALMKGKGGGKVQQQNLKQSSSGQEQNPKNDLNNALTLLLERGLTKEDCVYEMEEADGKHIATLQVAALTTEIKEFKGKPAENKKAAQVNAAKRALGVLGKEIKVAKKAHEA